MEPDHFANIAKFMDNYKDAIVVSGEKAFAMMNNYFGTDYQDRRVVVKEGLVIRGVLVDDSDKLIEEFVNKNK